MSLTQDLLVVIKVEMRVNLFSPDTQQQSASGNLHIVPKSLLDASQTVAAHGCSAAVL